MGVLQTWDPSSYELSSRKRRLDAPGFRYFTKATAARDRRPLFRSAPVAAVALWPVSGAVRIHTISHDCLRGRLQPPDPWNPGRAAAACGALVQRTAGVCR